MGVPRGNAWFGIRNKEGHPMIFGNIESTDLSTIGHEGVRRAIEWARDHDLFALPCGRNDIDGDALYVNVAEYDSKVFEDCKFEAHKRYIDVQVVASGVERIDSQAIAKCEAGEFDEEGDFMLLEGEAATQVILEPGSFAAYFPDDAHKPGIAVDGASHNKKCVFKVLV